ncbi:MAG: ATP-binding cassette domain-containing protein [Hyphomicrobiaceae bacterium]
MRDATTQLGTPCPLLPLETQALTFAAKDGTRLIDEIDLTLDDGRLTVIMGPNGAGKSVLLRLLHGLIAPTSGTISYAGRLLDDASRKRQALVFQRPVLLRRSVAANIDFVLGLGSGHDRRRRNELLDRVGLLDRAGQPARLLSGGEQQRLALVRALATQPDMLFLDEPTANLDPASTQIIERIAKDAQAGGIKVVFVTHDIAQGRRLADEVVFLNRGRLAEFTAADDFFSTPQSKAGAAYLAGRIDY